MKNLRLVLLMTCTLLTQSTFAVEDNAPIIHQVKPGDELMNISKKYYGTTKNWKYIIDANPGVSPSSLSEGMKIKIPILPNTKIEFLGQDVALSPEEANKPKEEQKSAPAPVITREIASEVIEVEMKEVAPEAQEVIEFKPQKVSVVKKYRQESEDGLQFDETAPVKDKFEILQKEYLKLKIKNQNLVDDLIDYEKKEAQFSSWERDKQDLVGKMKELEGQLNSTSKQKDILEESNPLFVPSMLTYSQEQVLKEKNRILTHRFWLQKNKEVDKCILNFPENDNYSEKRFQEFVEYLNEQFGSDKVYVEFTDNKIIFQMPGRYVYGNTNPKVVKEYTPILFKISEYLNDLPVEAIHFSSFSPFEKVETESKSSVSGLKYSLSQSMELHRYFVEDLGWSSRMLSSGSYGFQKTGEKKLEKSFDVMVKFRKKMNAERSVASIPATDKVLQDISKEIFQKLHEPKYGSIELKADELHLELGRHYFFDEELRLTEEGKFKLKTLFEMFALATDVKYQVIWVPGSLEMNNSDNMKNALHGMDTIKDYLAQNYEWSKNRLEVLYLSRQNVRVPAETPHEDKINKRLIFKIIPLSINVRKFGEPSTK
ncbi:MAG: LysM peptidoglycan-binding domain-containing protein [Bacteriovoracaceae bacterium]|nr:LysM peptidoglycan-binding domain-containing protein [Bacteriovoracaceae bacterium]